MAKIIGLPKLSPTMDEGTLSKWVKKEGDAVDVDDLLAEVETDKATMEFRSFDKGVLLKILAPEGESLAPDAPVAIIGQKGEDISALVASAAGGAKAPSPPVAKADVPAGGSGVSPVPSQAVGQATVPTVADHPAPAGSAPANPSSRGADGRVLASPLVRKVAREQGIDLGGVQGTGPHGRIVKRDLDTWTHTRPSAFGQIEAPSAEAIVEPLSQMRKTIARRLTESKQTVPHFYLTIDVDAEPLLETRAMINAELEADGRKVSVNDMLIKACAVALRRYPRANASFMGDSIHIHQRVDISVAVAIPDGLITPVIRNADKKGVAHIAEEVRSLAARARDKKLKPEEFTNGTFSISNLGMYGIEEFSAVINPPEGAILAVGAVRDEAVVRDHRVVPGKRMKMTLSCDHRVIDGAIGAEFLSILKRFVEKPASMII
ncbi:MAG: pyruvate dehydrogenase complex dihydrolipoamide acetyltransferase [Polyangiales bacterium]